MLFSGKDMVRLLVPLIVEQLLAIQCCYSDYYIRVPRFTRLKQLSRMLKGKEKICF